MVNTMSKDVLNLSDSLNSTDKLADSPCSKVEPMRIENTQGLSLIHI